MYLEAVHVLTSACPSSRKKEKWASQRRSSQRLGDTSRCRISHNSPMAEGESSRWSINSMGPSTSGQTEFRWVNKLPKSNLFTSERSESCWPGQVKHCQISPKKHRTWGGMDFRSPASSVFASSGWHRLHHGRRVHAVHRNVPATNQMIQHHLLIVLFSQSPFFISNFEKNCENLDFWLNILGLWELAVVEDPLEELALADSATSLPLCSLALFMISAAVWVSWPQIKLSWNQAETPDFRPNQTRLELKMSKHLWSFPSMFGRRRFTPHLVESLHCWWAHHRRSSNWCCCPRVEEMMFHTSLCPSCFFWKPRCNSCRIGRGWYIPTFCLKNWPSWTHRNASSVSVVSVSSVAEISAVSLEAWRQRGRWFKTGREKKSKKGMFFYTIWCSTVVKTPIKKFFFFTWILTAQQKDLGRTGLAFPAPQQTLP